MQAIVTKYHGPTNFRGSRVSAKADAGRVIIEWDCALDSEANHDAAAKALCAKLGWEGTLASGGLPDRSGNAYVFVRRTDGRPEANGIEIVDPYARVR